MKNKYYKIKIDGEREFERIVKILLAHGYVYNTMARLKSYEAVERFVSYNTDEKKWFLIGEDKVCKMVISSTNFDRVNPTFKEITVEEFIKFER